MPTRSGGCISLDFIKLPTALSGQDFVQVHMHLLTGRDWLVPTTKTATAESEARNLVASVFRDVGLPNVTCTTVTVWDHNFEHVIHERLMD